MLTQFGTSVSNRSVMTGLRAKFRELHSVHTGSEIALAFGEAELDRAEELRKAGMLAEADAVLRLTHQMLKLYALTV